MAAHGRLKNEFMEDEKYHNLVTWLILCWFVDRTVFAENYVNFLTHILTFSVDRYDYIVNGEALKEIHEYMEVEHTFSEYTEVIKS